MPTQTSALCLFSVCHALFVSPGNTSTHKHSHSFVGSGGKKRRERMEGKGVGGGGEVSMRGFFLLNVMYSEVLSACGSQTHCVLQVLINSVLYFEYSSVCQRLYFLVPLYFLMITSLFIIKYIQMMRDIIFLPFLFFFLIHGTAGREVVTLW